MKNRYAKGRKAELEYVKILESQGYKCITAPKGNRFTKQKDLFDWWDIVAYKPLEILTKLEEPYCISKDLIFRDGGNWLVIQVKSNNTSGVLKKLQEAAKELPIGTKAQLAIRIDGKRDINERWDIRDLR